MGFGAWAIVAQQIVNTLIDTVILYITVKWRPTREFSFKRLKELFSYGWKLLLSSLLDTGYNNLTSLIIGKIYSSSELAYYNKGRQFPNLAITNINNTIDSVLLPVLSSEQEDIEKVRNLTRRAIKISTYIIAPIMIGIAFVAEPLVRLLLTEKWLPCVFFLRVYCITFLFYPIHTSNLNAIKALGRSDLFLKLEILKKIVGISCILLTMNISIKAMTYSLLFSSLLAQIFNAWPNKQLINYGYLSQLKDILPELTLSLVMGICIYPISLIGLSDLLTLILQVLIGIVVYLFGSYIFKIDSFNYLLDIIKTTVK